MIDNPKYRKVLLIAGVIAVLVALGPLLFQTILYWQAGRFAGDRIGEVKGAVGLNPWLGLLWTTVGTGVAGIAFWLIFSLSQKKIMTGFAILGVMSAVTYSYLWMETKNDYFTAEGTPLKCFVEVAGSLRVIDKVKFDRKTSAVCSDITSPELAAAIETCVRRQEAGSMCLQKLEQRPKRYWSTFKGGPAIVWYFKDARGRVELFDMPGQHPKLGDELKPVTRAIVEEVELQFDKAETLAREVESSRKARTQPAPTPATDNPLPSTSNIQGRGEPSASSQLERYIDTSTASKGGDAVAVDGPLEITRSIVAQLPGPLAVSPFKQAFFDDQIFDRALAGDAEAVRKTGLGNHYRRIYLVRVSKPRTATAKELEGFTRADASVEFTEIDVPAATVIRRRNQALTGRGFSRETALADLSDGGVRQLMESLGR